MSDSHSLLDDLQRREREGRPVTIGLVGTGEMGTDILTQVSLMPGIRIGAIVELELAAARKAIAVAGLAEDVGRETSDVATVQRIIDGGGIALASNHLDVCTCEAIDVLIDATGSPSFGARLAVDAFDHGKHLVLMNVEADVTIGRHAASAEADRRPAWSIPARAGDETCRHDGARGLRRSARLRDRRCRQGQEQAPSSIATPRRVRRRSRRRNMNPRMLVEFVDGSKTMIEMVAVANATGLVPDVPGMHGRGRPRRFARCCAPTKRRPAVAKRRGRLLGRPGRGAGRVLIVETRHPGFANALRICMSARAGITCSIGPITSPVSKCRCRRPRRCSISKGHATAAPAICRGHRGGQA